jgi:hypothetical protein
MRRVKPSTKPILSSPAAVRTSDSVSLDIK